MSPSVLDPPDRGDYELFREAVSTAIRETVQLPLSMRCAIVDRAWRILHPESRCGQ